MSESDRGISFVFPKSGNLFYEKKNDYKFCKPSLMPIRTYTLEKLEKMQEEAQKQLQTKNSDTSDTKESRGNQ